MKGRKAIPNRIIELRGGTAHTHEKARQEPNLPVKIPLCPPHLDDVAHKEWLRVTKILKSIGMMTLLDRSTLAAYCEAYSRWVKATTKMNEMGMVYAEGRQVDDKGKVIKQGIPRANPYIKIAKEAFDQMIKTAILFGMSPSSRASLSILSQNSSPATDKTEIFRMLKHGNDNK